MRLTVSCETKRRILARAETTTGKQIVKGSPALNAQMTSVADPMLTILKVRCAANLGQHYTQ